MATVPDPVNPRTAPSIANTIGLALGKQYSASGGRAVGIHGLTRDPSTALEDHQAHLTGQVRLMVLEGGARIAGEAVDPDGPPPRG